MTRKLVECSIYRLPRWCFREKDNITFQIKKKTFYKSVRSVNYVYVSINRREISPTKKNTKRTNEMDLWSSLED